MSGIEGWEEQIRGKIHFLHLFLLPLSAAGRLSRTQEGSKTVLLSSEFTRSRSRGEQRGPQGSRKEQAAQPGLSAEGSVSPKPPWSTGNDPAFLT